MRARQGLLLAPAQDASPQRRGHASRDFVLDRKHVVERAIEPLRPAVVPAGDFYQLDRDAQPIIGLPDAALEQRFNVELAPHFAHVRAGVPKLKRRRSCGHAKAIDLRERVDEFLGQPFAQVVLVAIRTHVEERQNRDGRNRMCTCRRVRTALGRR